jgi:hypothetical protein
VSFFHTRTKNGEENNIQIHSRKRWKGVLLLFTKFLLGSLPLFLCL